MIYRLDQEVYMCGIVGYIGNKDASEFLIDEATIRQELRYMKMEKSG